MFKPGMKVVVLKDNNEIERGVIRSICEDLRIAIVATDDVKKVHYSHLGVEVEEKVQEEKKSEPIGKEAITITPGEFMEITARVIAKKTIGRDPLITYGLSVFTAEIHTALFYNEADND